MILVKGDHEKVLNGLLQLSAEYELTYSERGQTRSDNLPAGYRHDRVTLQVGQGHRDWNRAQDAIRTWRLHHHAGFKVTPPNAPLEEGRTVIVSRNIGPVLVAAPCRIVYVTDSGNRFGFAYGTLPGHPERGEEAFHVVQRDDGTVFAEIVVFSIHAELLTRLAGPAARLIQKVATRRYLEGVRAHVARM